MPQRSDQQVQWVKRQDVTVPPTPQEQAGEVATRRAGSASPTPNRRLRFRFWRTWNRGWKRGTLPRLAKVQGVWEAGAEQQLWTCADGAWSMSALITFAAPRLSPAPLFIEIFEGMTTRDSRLGLATRGLLRTVFEAPSRGRRQRDLPRLPVPWEWPLFVDVVSDTAWSRRSRRTYYSRERRQCGRVTEILVPGSF